MSARARFVVALVALTSSLAGCLRSRFDLCSLDPPHEECTLLDAGRDGALDAANEASVTEASVSDAELVDAAAEDSSAAHDAGVTSDAP